MSQSYNLLLAVALTVFALCDMSLAQLKNNSPPPTSIAITVTVTDKRKEMVSGLPQDAFTVSDDIGEREITSFSSEDVPMSIAILIDLSGSIRSQHKQKKIGLIVDALSNFMQQSHPSNEYFVIGFDNRPSLLLDGAQDTNAALSVLQKLASAKLGGNTALYDACLFSIEKLAHALHPKQVILLISDGRDNSSQSKLNGVRRSLKAKNIMVL